MTATLVDHRMEHAAVDQQNRQRLVGVVWGLLVVNSLGSLGVKTIVPIPRSVLQMITMGALVAAFLLALLLNPRLRFRPSAFLLLLSLLLIIAIASSSSLQSGYGALARCARLAVFIATLWLLTVWWDDSLAFVRHHLRALGIVLASVALGLVLAPGLARPADFQSRLVGVLWPITATQVGDYAAVVVGLIIVLWLTGSTSGWSAVAISLPAMVLLILTHTRTALVGLAVALAAAGMTIALSHARARRALAVAALGAVVVAAALAGPLMTWLRRGQDQDALANLTGRQKVWHVMLSERRMLHEQLFGVGLTNKSFHGLPIDSAWLSAYYEQGLVGVAIIAVIMLVMLFAVFARPPSAARTCAVFLLVYCLVASYTQVGLGDVTGYLLHFVVAATLLTARSPTPVQPDLSLRAPG
jgi:O-antigen ligase